MPVAIAAAGDWHSIAVPIQCCRTAWQLFVELPVFLNVVVAAVTADPMFTGLVEGQGLVRLLTEEPDGLRLKISPCDSCFAPSELSVGDSVSVSGCCLTVVDIGNDAMDFQAGQETLSKTNLGLLADGSRVNLERSLAVGDRLGGHFVQGHVDGTGVVDEIIRHDEWVDMGIQLAPEFAAMMVPKGSVTLDGVSLTLVNVQPEQFSVALIPHTLQATTLGNRRCGDRVNIELDILGKYVAKLVKNLLPS